MNKIPNRKVICDVLIEQAKNDRDIVVLCSDSRGSASLAAFFDTYPDQSVEVGIAEQDLYALHTTQLFLVLTLHTQFPNIVTRLVIVVFFNIGWRNLSHIAQYMSSHWRLILSHTTLLHIEAGESEHLLLKNAEILIRQLAHKQLLRKA